MGASVYEKQLRRHTLRDLVPVESFDAETHLFTMANGYIGFGFISRPLPSGDDSVTQRLNVLFSFDYPKESFIQIMLMASQDIRPALDKIKIIRNTHDSALKESLRSRIKMLEEGSNQSMSLHAQSYIREFKVVITVKIPLEQKNQLPKPHEIALAHDLRLSCEQTLKSAGFLMQTMDAEMYLRVMGQILHWKPSANWRSSAEYYDATSPINEQVSEFDDMIQIDDNGVWLGDKRLRILSLGRLPAQMCLQNMRRMIGDPLTGLRGIHGNFYINLNIFIPDNVDEKQKADQEMNSINYQAFGPMLKFNPKLLFKKDSADLLFKSINDGDRILKIKLSIGLFTDSLDKSETRLTEAQTYFSEIGWNIKEDKFITLPMLINALPLCADPKALKFLQRYKRVGSKDAVEFLPIISDWSGTGTPQLTFISRSGQIMAMDVFDSNCNGQVKPDTFLSHFPIVFPLKNQRRLIA